MTGRDLRFGMVISTDGSVMNEVLKDPFFRTRVHLVVVEHAGPAYEKSCDRGLPTMIVEDDDADQFCNKVLKLFAQRDIDYVFSFYTKFYSATFRSAFSDRILNFHPSLLPAFKGMDGFGDTVTYPARFAGNTVELIADVMDEGKIIMQTVCPINVTRYSCSNARLSFNPLAGFRRAASRLRAIASTSRERNLTAPPSHRPWIARRWPCGIPRTPTFNSDEADPVPQPPVSRSIRGRGGLPEHLRGRSLHQWRSL
jgi:folate-dependent phosphoribosylglycinamide formyltransferase PurN